MGCLSHGREIRIRPLETLPANWLLDVVILDLRQPSVRGLIAPSPLTLRDLVTDATDGG